MLLLNLGCPVPWQKIREVFLTLFVLWDTAEDVLQPGPFVYAPGFAGGKQRVYHGRSLGGFVIAAEQVVLATLCWQRSYVDIVR